MSLLMSYHQTFVNAVRSTGGGNAYRVLVIQGPRANSRDYYLINYVARRAKANGLKAFYWDEGSLGNNGLGLMNRSNNTVGDQRALNAVISGSL